MTDWIEWNGGECPVDGLTSVDYRMRTDRADEANRDVASMLRWDHQRTGGDIIAYRLVDAPSASMGSALSQQVGGNHYKGAVIQPVEFCVKNRLESLESAIVKRAFRHDKPTGKGREDVEKIIHEARLLLELKYGVAA